jgi:DNA-binding MarR family transcriptional regulator
MERAGWVTRQKCEEDARGQWAILTDEGWELLVKAAPVHVESVRTHLLDVLGTEDFAALGEMCTRVLAALEESQQE